MIAGIDFGTVNSTIAVMSGGRPLVITNSEGERVTPSVVALHSGTHEWHVGTPARRQSITNPDRSLFNIKRVMGRKFTDRRLQDNIPWLPYEVTSSPTNECEVVIAGNIYGPQGIAAAILSKLKADAGA